MKQNLKFVKQLIAELSSKDEILLLKTLEKIKTKGTDEVIEPLVNLYSNTEFSSVKTSIKTILNELKSISGAPFLINCLPSSTNEIKELILGALWNANMNPTEFLPEIILASCDGGYMVAVEAFTILENLEGPFNEEKLTESRLILNDYFAQPKDDKYELMKSILFLINEMDASLDA